MNITIRTLMEADIESVQHVVMESWNDTYEGVIPLDIQMQFLREAYSKDSLVYRILHSHFFVAELAGEIVGFANFSLMESDGQVELGALYLLPSVKGQGIGTLLFKTGLKRIGRVKKVLVHVEKQNDHALQFYKKKGFIYMNEFGEIFYGHPLQTIQLMLYLN